MAEKAYLKLWMGKKCRRYCALFLAFALFIHMVPLAADVFAAGADSAIEYTSLVQDGISVDMTKELSSYGNGIIGLTLTAKAAIKKEYKGLYHSASTNGYYAVPADGWYLVELYGGSGADGESQTWDGGDGGTGGRVYGKIYLEAGNTLIYTIGSNGVRTSVSNTGGGANGSGGDKGDTGACEVGGGGGYSALYLLEETVSRSYVTSEERLNKYILIAGGGGGGGAGNGFPYEPTNFPNGGAGGNVATSAGGTLTANDNPVAGTYFAGANGLSSGGGTANAGRGGTYVPGTQLSTAFNEYETGVANDWPGLANPETTPGAGGNGNLRGGCGGAGFCGGGGGIMEALLIAANVGGGGGGSSFIADTVDYRNLTASDRTYLQSNHSATGGSCHITYLGSEGTPNTAPFENVTITGNVSKYFDVISAVGEYSNQSAVYGRDVATSQSASYTTFTAAAVDISPNAGTGLAGNVFRLQLMLQAKEGFAGGNNVPILYEGNTVQLTPSGKTALAWEADTATDYANVPLQFDMTTKSYTSSDTTKSYPVTSLYVDAYSDVRNNLSAHWQYDFISSLTGYTVQKEGTSTNLSGSVTPTATTKYNVQYTVTPKSGAVAEVGQQVGQEVIKGAAVISIVSANQAAFDTVTVTGSKILNYDGTYHKYGMNIREQSATMTMPAGVTLSTGGTTGSYVIEKTGWYYIQAWGGNGQGSGSATVYRYNGNVRVQGSNASGGTGGYLSGYLYLTAGEIVFYNLGTTSSTTHTANASDQFTAATGEEAYASTTGGTGGGFTKIYLNDGTVLMIAGGGGGAGGAGAAATTGTKTATANARAGYGAGSSYTTTLLADSSYSGKSGSRGSASAEYKFLGGSATASAGTAGSAGANYRNANIGDSAYTMADGTVMTIPASVKTAGSALSTTKTGRAGNIVITPLETEEAATEREKMDDIAMESAITKYFKVDSVSADFGTTNSYTRKQTENGDGSVTVVYTSGSNEMLRYTYSMEKVGEATVCKIYDVDFEPTAHRTGNTVYYTADVNFTLDLLPADGFLGGNDVPLAVYDALEPDADPDNHPNRGMKLSHARSDKFLYLPESPTTDYANVDVTYRFTDRDLTTYDKTILAGESVQLSQMYETDVLIPDDWRGEFVEFQRPEEQTYTPVKTEQKTVTISVVPKHEPQIATVVSAAASATYSKPATIFVEYTVGTSGLSRLNWDGPDKVLSGEGVEGIIEPESGYLLPDSVTVTVGGATLSASNYSYDSITGALAIPAAYVTGHVSVSGAGQVQTFRLRFLYPDDSVDGGIAQYTRDYVAGTAIDLAEWYDEKTEELAQNAPTGHAFQWDWQMDSVDGVYYMPAQNWDVIGTYTPLKYTLTINYYKAGTTDPVAEPVSAILPYGGEYSYISPKVDGYLAQTTVVTGTITDDTVIDVEYTATTGQLTVIYIYQDTGKEIEEFRISESLEAGQQYSYDTQAVDGYTPDQPTVSGTMDADGETVYVYYIPNRYTVTFDAMGGSLSAGEGQRNAVFNSRYSFDGTAHKPLPQPVKTGFEFEGWYTDPADGERIDENSIVTTAGDHTLYARYKTHTFKLEIHYVFSDGSQAHPTEMYEFAYGEAYFFDPMDAEHAIVGYTPDPVAVQGSMGSGNKTITVTYYIDRHTVTVHFKGPEGSSLNLQDVVLEKDYGQSFEVAVPDVKGYTVESVDASGYNAETGSITGTVGTEDLQYTVKYAYIPYCVSVQFVVLGEYVQAPQTVVFENLNVDSDIPYKVPGLDGYNANLTAIGIRVADLVDYMTDNSYTYTVTYTPIEYQLTVDYFYAESAGDLAGTQVAPSYSEKIAYGGSYEVVSPEIEGHEPNLKTVRGTMPAQDVTVTVLYYSGGVPVDLTIEWGNLTYDYTNRTYNTTTHLYEIPPEGENFVRVSNNEGSSVPFTVSIAYTPSSDNGIRAYFTQSDTNSAGTERYTSLSATLTPPEGAEENALACYLWLEGVLSDEAIESANEGAYASGTCTVTIGGVTP